MISQDYQEPATIEEAEDRLSAIKVAVIEIEFQLSTTTLDKFKNKERYPNPEREFKYWKINAKKARACKLQEQEMIKDWLRRKKRGMPTNWNSPTHPTPIEVLQPLINETKLYGEVLK